MKAMSQDERMEVFRSAVMLVQQNVRTLEVFCKMLEGLPDEKSPLTAEEQRVVDRFEPGTVMTGKQIAKQTGDDPDTGSFKELLATIVKKGHLINKRPGYALPED